MSPRLRCRCHFCRTNRKHPEKHASWYTVTHLLMQAESLDPKHSIKQLACSTCGHVRAA